MDCVNKQKNSQKCNCTYEPCSRKGICCECINYHRSAGELPACYFSRDVERGYDRSIQNFIQTQKKK